MEPHTQTVGMAAIPYLGECLSVLVAIVWAFAVILFRKSGETVHPIGLNFFKNVMAMFLFVPTIWLSSEILLYPAPADEYLLLLLSGALGIGIADTLFLHCLNRIGAGLTAIVDCLYSPFIIGLSVLWLAEKLSLLQVIGVAIIVGAVLMAAPRETSGGRSRRDLIIGIICGVLAMAFMALGIVMIKPLLDRAPLLWVTEIRLVGGVAILCLVLLFHPSRRNILSSIFSRQGRSYTISGSFVGAYIAMVLWLGGMKFTQVSTASALNQTSNIFIFVFAAIFLREKITLHRTIGIVLGVGGALLVTFG